MIYGVNFILNIIRREELFNIYNGIIIYLGNIEDKH